MKNLPGLKVDIWSVNSLCDSDWTLQFLLRCNDVKADEQSYTKLNMQVSLTTLVAKTFLFFLLVRQGLVNKMAVRFKVTITFVTCYETLERLCNKDNGSVVI